MPVAYLPAVADMSPASVPDFDREQWTTCYIGRLAIGDLFAFTTESPMRPAVLTEKRSEYIPGEAHGWVAGAARYVDTGDLVAEFKVRANASVVVRCDMHYRSMR
uniref:hypothetical protein n=1 Tax=Streptomyces tubercidicus TaxID=47759 RepID=UPI0030E5C238|nr:hypothetical protein OG690_38200 [Streptomyces tubercidicus]